MKFFLVISFSLGIICVAVFLFFYEDQYNDKKAGSLAAESREKSSTLTARKKVESISASTRIDKPMQIATEEDYRQYEKWRESETDISFSSNSPYLSYSTDTLRAMSDQGDVVAMQYLAVKLMKEGDKSQSYKILEKAAIFGARELPYKVQAEVFLSVYEAGLANLYDEEETQSALVEALSNYKVASLRGNKKLEIVDLNLVTKEYGLELTEDDIAQIDERANTLYTSMESKRRDLGLGEFDNKVPEEIVRVFDDMRQKGL